MHPEVLNREKSKKDVLQKQDHKARFICSYDEYDRFERTFSEMSYQAGEYTPTSEELELEIIPNLKEYITFLLWIDMTGLETEENRYVRKMIHRILIQNIELVEEIPGIANDDKKGNEL